MMRLMVKISLNIVKPENLLKLKKERKALHLELKKTIVTTKLTTKKKISKPSTKETISALKTKDKAFLIPHNPLLLYSKKAKDRFLTKFCTKDKVKDKCINMNEYKSFKISFYLYVLDWDKFLRLKVEHVSVG